MIRKVISFIAVTLLSMGSSFVLAASEPGSRGTVPASVALLAVGGHNPAWNGYGGGALVATFPINPYFTVEGGVQGTSAGNLTTLLQLQPTFAVGKGEVFLNTFFYYGGFFKDNAMELATALCVGYKMEYVSAQVGFSFRMLGSISHWRKEGMMSEPFDLTYRVAAHVRPQDSVWNIGGGVSNFTPYHLERGMSPIFFLDGSYRLGRHFSLLADIHIKPAGMFHLAASWYGFWVDFGFSYSFGL